MCTEVKLSSEYQIINSEFHQYTVCLKLRFWILTPGWKMGWNQFECGFIFSSRGPNSISAISLPQRLRESYARGAYQMYISYASHTDTFKLYRMNSQTRTNNFNLAGIPEVMNLTRRIKLFFYSSTGTGNFLRRYNQTVIAVRI